MTDSNLTEEEQAQIESVSEKINDLMLKYPQYTALMCNAEEGITLFAAFAAGVYMGSALELSEEEAAKRDEVLTDPFEKE